MRFLPPVLPCLRQPTLTLCRNSFAAAAAAGFSKEDEVTCVAIQLVDRLSHSQADEASLLTRLPSIWYSATRGALWQSDFLTNHSLENLQVIVLCGVYVVSFPILECSRDGLATDRTLPCLLADQPRPGRRPVGHPRCRHQDCAHDGPQSTRTGAAHRARRRAAEAVGRSLGERRYARDGPAGLVAVSRRAHVPLMATSVALLTRLRSAGSSFSTGRWPRPTATLARFTPSRYLARYRLTSRTRTLSTASRCSRSPRKSTLCVFRQQMQCLQQPSR